MFKKLTSLCAKDNRGFSLIELIVVIAILGVLAGVAIPQIGNAVRKARINADISNAANIAAALSRAVVDQKIKEEPGEGEIEFGVLDSGDLKTVLVDNHYMQAIPNVRYLSDAYFAAEVTPDGKITVAVVDSEDVDTISEDDNIVYPEPKGEYAGEDSTGGGGGE